MLKHPVKPVDISVVVSVFGDPEWDEKAKGAMKSAHGQSADCEVVFSRGGTLAEARNSGVKCASGEFIILLDADDELDVDYVNNMKKAIRKTEEESPGSLWLYQPSTLGVYANGSEDSFPTMIPQKPLDKGNFMVIGTAFRKSLFESVGGFEEYEAYEDWELFIRMNKAGAGFCPVPKSIYRIGVNPEGRNSISGREALRLFNEIRRKHFT